MELAKQTEATDGGHSVHALREAAGTSDEVFHPFAERRSWRVACTDVGNRRRYLTVFVDEDRVVLLGPPGETAVLSVGQVGQLEAALREAAEQAGR